MVRIVGRCPLGGSLDAFSNGSGDLGSGGTVFVDDAGGCEFVFELDGPTRGHRHPELTGLDATDVALIVRVVQTERWTAGR